MSFVSRTVSVLHFNALYPENNQLSSALQILKENTEHLLTTLGGDFEMLEPDHICASIKGMGPTQDPGMIAKVIIAIGGSSNSCWLVDHTP